MKIGGPRPARQAGGNQFRKLAVFLREVALFLSRTGP